MTASINDALVLAPGVLIFPVSELPASVRHLARPQDQFALTRVGGRATTKLLDDETASLLEKFRQPITVVQAIIDMSRRRSLDPHALLDSAYATVKQLVAERTLIAPGTSPTPGPLGPGDTVGSFTVIRCIQALDGGNVYQARDTHGTLVALKVIPGDAIEGGRRLLAREARILAEMTGRHFPRVVQNGSDAERPFLALEWLTGEMAFDYAQRRRAPWRSAARAELLAAVISAVDAYADLHGQGVVHGDVHPKNILIAGGNARIVDFALSIVARDETLRSAPRGGVLGFYDPELAAAELAGRQPSPATERSDQYALAAVGYLMLTGQPYLPLGSDKRAALRQIVARQPLSFEEQGTRSWPEVEAVLGRALAKDPAQRFRSTSELASVLRAVAGESGGRRRDPGSAQLLATTMARLQCAAATGEHGVRKPPHASVNYGAAGVAFLWYRLGVLRGDPAMLLQAVWWLSDARRRQHHPDAFHNRDIGITADRVGRVSIYHALSGITLVEALVANARGDLEAAMEASVAFVREGRRPCSNVDVTLGRSSLLVGAALLTEALAGTPVAAESGLHALGDEIMAAIWAQLAAQRLDAGDLNDLGMAHGWAGVLYATLRWCEASGTALPHPAAIKLAELAGRGATDRRRWSLTDARWPQLSGAWCHGTAGYAHLWACAHRMTGDSQYEELCLGAAEHSWSVPSTIGSLCCGTAGQAYAMLIAYGLTGEARWLRRARTLARNAVGFVGTTGCHPNSLYKGDIGIALLGEELTTPERAGMPLFAPEGWPVRGEGR